MHGKININFKIKNQKAHVEEKQVQIKASTLTKQASSCIYELT